LPVHVPREEAEAMSEPFEDTLEGAGGSKIIRVGDYVTILEFDKEGKLVDFQMEDWTGCKKEIGATPGRFRCSVVGLDEECLEDPDEMREAIIRFWMRAFHRAASGQMKDFLEELLDIEWDPKVATKCHDPAWVEMADLRDRVADFLAGLGDRN